MRRWLPALYLILPASLLIGAGDRALGRPSVDLGGHLWMAWSASRGEIPTTTLLGWPEGVDLLPALGGWVDVALGGLLAPALGLIGAYNLTLAAYLVLAGVGGAALARSLGVGAGGAAVAGLLLQRDGFVAVHLIGGRPEQVGLGALALALAAAIGTWRGTWRPLPAGLAGSLLVYVSWELTLIGALALPLLGLGLGRPPPGLGRRAGRALGTFALAAGPWIGLFLSRAAATRAVDEGAFSLETALRASVGLLGWLEPGRPGPSTAALLGLLALPWIARRRGAAAALGGLALALILALGPAPSLWGPPPPGSGPAGPMAAAPTSLWGPFGWLQGIPILGWYHWPDRLLCSWSLAAAVAAGAAVSRLAGSGRVAAAAALGLALVGAAEAEQRATGLRPAAEYTIHAPRAVAALGEDPSPGAVLDLPRRPDPALHLDYQLLQLTHGRPILFHMMPQHLTRGDLARRVAEDPTLAWFDALLDRRPPEARAILAEDLAALKARGFGFVALHQPGWPPDRWRMARRALQRGLGEPEWREGDRWMCWRIP